MCKVRDVRMRKRRDIESKGGAGGLYIFMERRANDRQMQIRHRHRYYIGERVRRYICIRTEVVRHTGQNVRNRQVIGQADK